MNSGEPSTTVSKTVLTKITFSGHILNTCCVKWSEDNCIAILIDKHIYILSSRTDPTEVSQQFPYHKSIIANPEKTMIFDCGIDVKQLISISSLDEQQIIMCDPTLAGETLNSATFRSYRRVDWSPITRKLGCLLAALTLDHRLIIYHKDVNGWQPITDLSLNLYKKLKKLWTSSEAINYQLYRSRIYSLATNAFCWAQNWSQKTDSMSCRLFLGSMNGLITVWTITIGPDIDIDVQLVYKWETTFDQILCVKNMENFLIISSINGTVSVILTDILADSMPDPVSLWPEVDNIPVNDFAIKPLDDNNYEVLFAKSEFIIICRFSADTMDGSPHIRLISSKTVSGLHRMPSTAVCAITEFKYLLTAMDGRLIEIEVLDDLTVNQCEVSLDCVNSTAMCSHGVDRSPNGALSVLVQSMAQMHDHLVLKESVQVVVFTNLSFDSLTDILCDKYLSDAPTETMATFDNCFDYFDCVRSFLSNGLYSSFGSSLFGLIDKQYLISGNRDLFKLRVIRFITRTYISNTNKNNNNNNNTSDVIKRLESNARLCEDLILKLFVEDVCKQVVSEPHVLTESQLVSLKNISLWHSKRFRQTLASDNRIDLESVAELCPICVEPIVFTNKIYGQCPQSHRFNRCVNSLVLCDLVKHKYKKCFRCAKSIVISPSIWNHSNICLYCG